MYVPSWALIRQLSWHSISQFAQIFALNHPNYAVLLHLHDIIWFGIYSCEVIERLMHVKLRSRGSWIFVCWVTSLNAIHHETSTVSNGCFRVQHRPSLSLLEETAVLICSRHWNWTLSLNTNTRYVRGSVSLSLSLFSAEFLWPCKMDHILSCQL